MSLTWLLVTALVVLTLAALLFPWEMCLPLLHAALGAAVGEKLILDGNPEAALIVMGILLGSSYALHMAQMTAQDLLSLREDEKG